MLKDWGKLLRVGRTAMKYRMGRICKEGEGRQKATGGQGRWPGLHRPSAPTQPRLYLFSCASPSKSSVVGTDGVRGATAWSGKKQHKGEGAELRHGGKDIPG